jgi:lipid-binding SYLF domain-containing protein
MKSTEEAEAMKSRNLYAATGLAVIALFAGAAALAASKAEIDASVGTAVRHFHALNPANKELMHKAAGVLVFPRVTKGGIGVAGEYGEGALRVNHQTVGYYSLSSASIGLTLGIAKHSEIIMFMTQDALDNFMNSKGWSIGADTGVALIKTGAGGDYDTQTLQKPILGFVFGEKGLIGDLSLEGSKINSIER